MKNTSKRDQLIESIIEGLMTGRRSEVLKTFTQGEFLYCVTK